ncbi:MAG: MiaB/RimO family radical SAM methylthiotransferase [Kiritimatiellae bacterium]|nr:MiaB/RimO family radical SAM methylthiotransferase [Kiritimatiellia bacterium]
MKFLIHTYGCQMNVRDSEAVEALLLAAGHEKAANEAEAELVIVNSCTVRQKAEEKAIGKAGNLIADGKITGMMGCAVKRLGGGLFKKLPKLAFAVAPGELLKIPYVKGGDPLAAHAQTGLSAFVTVMTGCDNCCSYCIVPKVRGHESSRPADDIVREVECLAARGVKEVTLLGQSVLRYKGFPRLLRRLQEIEGLARIRFTSAHPKGCTDELVAVYGDCPKVCRHLHLPVQSGSDRILAEMGRRYTRAEYLAAVAKLRAFDPEFSVTTDVIVGYPGETEEDFEATRTLMDAAGFDNAFIFKYSPRPGTRSAALPDDVTTEEKERRDQVLLADQECRGQARNDRLIGTVREVIAEGPSKRNAARWAGRDGGNRIVVWDADGSDCVGDLVKLRITEAHPQILIGERL